ncbi:MAG: hypothetical protein PVG03_09255 [Desulfarculaceae bacterium]|jgi:hypothetical protein
MTAKLPGERVKLVGMIVPNGGQTERDGGCSLLLNVPGDADYRLINNSPQPLREWVYERVFVSGRVSHDNGPVLTVEQLEVLEDRDSDYWDEDGY